LITELLAGLAITKKGETEGKPIRPKIYRGTGHTYNFGKPRAMAPKRRK